VTLGREKEAKDDFSMADRRFEWEQLILVFSAKKGRCGLLLLYEHLEYQQEIVKLALSFEVPEVGLKPGSTDLYILRD
jgi:hypothetical protein